jgi:acetolactate synthase-1/3 small subunit
MAMRRGHHTSRVLKALGTPVDGVAAPPLPARDEILPNEFEELQDEEA